MSALARLAVALHRELERTPDLAKRVAAYGDLDALAAWLARETGEDVESIRGALARIAADRRLAVAVRRDRLIGFRCRQHAQLGIHCEADARENGTSSARCCVRVEERPEPETTDERACAAMDRGLPHFALITR